MKIAVLGSGNGAHAVAYEWANAGHDVYMYDFPQFGTANIAAINEKGGIDADGEMKGFQKITYAGFDLETVLKDAAMVFVVGPAYSTEPFGKACAPYIQDGQIYVICPSSCMGAVTFKKALGLALDDEKVIVAETSTLPYAARMMGNATIMIYNRLKAGYFLATIPHKYNDKVYDLIQPVYEGIEKAASVLQVALQNGNPMIHPTITTLNAARIESTNGNFCFYEEGVTPGVANLMKAVDEERIAIGAKLGLVIESDPVLGKRQGYNTETDYLGAYAHAEGFKGIKAQSQLDYRYYNEDVGFGMVFWSDLADRVGVEVPHIKAIIRIASTIMQRDYAAEKARTMDTLGLGNYSMEELRKII